MTTGIGFVFSLVGLGLKLASLRKSNIRQSSTLPMGWFLQIFAWGPRRWVRSVKQGIAPRLGFFRKYAQAHPIHNGGTIFSSAGVRLRRARLIDDSFLKTLGAVHTLALLRKTASAPNLVLQKRQSLGFRAPKTEYFLRGEQLGSFFHRSARWSGLGS